MFWERIQNKTRYFIPVDRAADVLEDVLEGRPITDVIGKTGGPSARTQQAKQEDEGEGIAKMADVTRQSRTARRREEGEKVGIAAADIQKTVERLFGIAIRQGGFSTRAAGIYEWLTKRGGKPGPEVARTKEDHYANLAVVSHEVSHHIDEKTHAVRSMHK